METKVTTSEKDLPRVDKSKLFKDLALKEIQNAIKKASKGVFLY